MIPVHTCMYLSKTFRGLLDKLKADTERRSGQYPKIRGKSFAMSDEALCLQAFEATLLEHDDFASSTFELLLVMRPGAYSRSCERCRAKLHL